MRNSIKINTVIMWNFKKYQRINTLFYHDNIVQMYNKLLRIILVIILYWSDKCIYLNNAIEKRPNLHEDKDSSKWKFINNGHKKVKILDFKLDNKRAKKKINITIFLYWMISLFTLYRKHGHQIVSSKHSFPYYFYHRHYSFVKILQRSFGSNE